MCACERERGLESTRTYFAIDPTALPKVKPYCYHVSCILERKMTKQTNL